jgi:hypothetical protein
MKIQPMQQIANHLIQSNSDHAREPPSIHRDICSVKWCLWHGRVGRVIGDFERLLASLKHVRREDDFSIVGLYSLGLQLLTYVRSNRHSIVNYGKRHRAGLRVATSLAEPAVNSLVAKRMVKNQQMRWSFYDAHKLMQVRTAALNGDLHERLQPPFRR